MLSEGNVSYHQELVTLLFSRLNTIFPVRSGNYMQRIKERIIQHIIMVFRLYPSFVIDLKPTLLRMLQESQGDLFNHICFITGESIATCKDDIHLTTSIIVQYYEVLVDCMMVVTYYRCWNW
jgi:hypothetical protein